MKVLPLALNIVAATLATAATILFLTNRGEKLRAQAELTRSEGQLEAIRGEASSFRARIETLDKEAVANAAKLRQTESSLSDARIQASDLGANLSQARNLLALREQNETALNREIAKLRGELLAAQGQLAGMGRLRGRIDELEQTLALARNRKAPDGSSMPETAGAPRGILAVGPESSFIVAAYGSREGAKAGQKLLVRRGTEFIATALISDVHEQLSIAQVDPRALRETLRKGDSIVLAP
jgi:hypothetical protein